MIDIHKWGFKSNIKWVIIEVAPLTASGLNEIVAAAEYRSQCLLIARACGYKVSGTHSGHKIIKLEETLRKDANGD